MLFSPSSIPLPVLRFPQPRPKNHSPFFTWTLLRYCRHSFRIVRYARQGKPHIIVMGCLLVVRQYSIIHVGQFRSICWKVRLSLHPPMGLGVHCHLPDIDHLPRFALLCAGQKEASGNHRTGSDRARQWCFSTLQKHYVRTHGMRTKQSTNHEANVGVP